MSPVSGPVLVLGGTGGIGRDIAARLRALGTDVTITGRDAARTAQVAAAIGCRSHPADAMDEASLHAAVEAATRDGQLAGLVYAVGSIPLKPLARLEAADMMEAYRLNVVGAALAAKRAAPALKSAQGSIVLFSSVAATQGFPSHAVIGPAKAAVAGLAIALAAELAPQVRVNAIAPSLTRTPLAAPILGNERMAEALAEMHPLRRLGEPRDIAALAAFLLGPEAGWITGQCFAVDGGRSSLRTARSG